MANVKAEKKSETVMYSQFQPWSTAGVLPCSTNEQVNSSGLPIPTKIGEFYKTPKPHPWRPMLGYELLEATPLPELPITNMLVDACRTPSGMVTEPLKFPNLITGFDRNASHAARAALYTRYTPDDWTQNQIRLYNEVNDNRKYCETMRTDAVCLMRKIDDKLEEQAGGGRQLGERITDITFWRNEVELELDKSITESDKMKECRRELEASMHDFDAQLHIAQECLYHRESRKGIDLVHDEVENALLKEIEAIKNSQKKLEQFVERCIDQLKNSRAAQHQLQINIQDKESALGIDTVCHQMNKFSGGLQHYGGIENYDSSTIDIEAWIESCNKIIKNSQEERAKSCRLRNNTDNVKRTISHELLELWNNTTHALERRIVEMSETKGKLQIHLQNIQQEILDFEKSIELIQRTISHKSSMLKVAHTRLEARAHRPTTELCKDNAQLRIMEEVKEINKIVNDMNMKLQQFEAQHQQLLCTRSNLEKDLKSKVDALFIDREKCMGLRRSYPMSSNVKF